eukprot:ANDGO_01430.mRNA.1 hypothetical protein
MPTVLADSSKLVVTGAKKPFKAPARKVQTENKEPVAKNAVKEKTVPKPKDPASEEAQGPVSDDDTAGAGSPAASPKEVNPKSSEERPVVKKAFTVRKVNVPTKTLKPVLPAKKTAASAVKDEDAHEDEDEDEKKITKDEEADKENSKSKSEDARQREESKNNKKPAIAKTKLSVAKKVSQKGKEEDNDDEEEKAADEKTVAEECEGELTNQKSNSASVAKPLQTSVKSIAPKDAQGGSASPGNQGSKKQVATTPRGLVKGKAEPRIVKARKMQDQKNSRTPEKKPRAKTVRKASNVEEEEEELDIEDSEDDDVDMAEVVVPKRRRDKSLTIVNEQERLPCILALMKSGNLAFEPSATLHNTILKGSVEQFLGLVEAGDVDPGLCETVMLSGDVIQQLQAFREQTAKSSDNFDDESDDDADDDDDDGDIGYADGDLHNDAEEAAAEASTLVPLASSKMAVEITALILAIVLQKGDVVEELLKLRGCKVQIVCLQAAVAVNSPEILRNLLKHVRKIPSDFVADAIENGASEEVVQILGSENGKQISGDVQKPLFAAAVTGNVIAARLFISLGGSPQKPDAEGVCPLEVALSHGNEAVVAVMLEASSTTADKAGRKRQRPSDGQSRSKPRVRRSEADELAEDLAMIAAMEADDRMLDGDGSSADDGDVDNDSETEASKPRSKKRKPSPKKDEEAKTVSTEPAQKGIKVVVKKQETQQARTINADGDDADKDCTEAVQDKE